MSPCLQSCLYFGFSRAFSFISRIPYTVVPVIPPSFSLCFHLCVLMTNILVTNLNYFVKNLSISSKVSTCGRRVVVQHQTIESVDVFWLNDLFIFFKTFGLQKTILIQAVYVTMPPFCRHPSLSLNYPLHVSSFPKVEPTRDPWYTVI